MKIQLLYVTNIYSYIFTNLSLFISFESKKLEINLQINDDETHIYKDIF